ncbi:heat shock protein, putative [Entamoeba dispar SAW760]|uniref:Heat shock protein, putative n=1 Tax=Entamoeba dispar (strain ATCC PRA-260 / SAW760) TaxID=370354 RepID=B0EUU2_ENTDS|nr:heat shock protein, putative [Entamoeba dispar SAW760]EDR21704.1 heat shock protein, putative [Entamoeba dispar SAW760]|eukprot:EDR21704.1 heat shock protein, putative [Entamoeba dispar SAW760]
MFISQPTRSTCIGIDLGTTNSCMCVFDKTTPRILENAEGKRTTPSCVSFTPTGILVGEPAKRMEALHPTTTISGIKRMIGCQYKNDKQERRPYKIVKGRNGEGWIHINGKTYSPTEISSIILKKLKKGAEAKLGKRVDEAFYLLSFYSLISLFPFLLFHFVIFILFYLFFFLFSFDIILLFCMLNCL